MSIHRDVPLHALNEEEKNTKLRDAHAMLCHAAVCSMTCRAFCCSNKAQAQHQKNQQRDMEVQQRTFSEMGRVVTRGWVRLAKSVVAHCKTRDLASFSLRLGLSKNSIVLPWRVCHDAMPMEDTMRVPSPRSLTHSSHRIE